MLKNLGFVVLVLMAVTSNALSLDDFVPSFLSSDKSAESDTNPAIAFSIPESSKKRNASSDSVWYCNRSHNVFCSKPDARKVDALAIESRAINSNSGGSDSSGNKYFNRNSNSYDQNAINNFNITDANQSALQAYSPKLNNYSTQEQLKNNVAVPIQAGKDTNINVGQQQIEFNIKY